MTRFAALRDRLPAPFALVVLGALAAIPLIYSSALIGANEDPTGHLNAIPAVVVNADIATTVTDSRGTTQALTLGDDLTDDLVNSTKSSNFDWSRATADEAAAGLANGTYFAVLEVPADFSARVASGLTVEPNAEPTAQRAQLTLRTDDAANFITGNIAKSLGTTLVDEISATVRQQYLSDVYLGFSDIHDDLGAAADGAADLETGLADLADGASMLPSGLTRLSTGSASAVDGARSLTSGVTSVAGGASQVAGGLDQLLAAYATLDDTQRVALLEQLDTAAHAVATGSSDAAAGSTRLVTGLATVSDGLASAAGSAETLAEGAADARDGATTLATELAAGTAQIPDFTATEADRLSAVTGTPIDLVTVRDHEAAGYGAGLAPYFLSLGLWVGAIATFLMRPALSPRLVGRRRAVVTALGSYAPNAVLGIVQALLAVLIADAILPIAASDLVGLAAFAVLAALTFQAIVQALVALLGPVGRFVALVLTVLQVSAAGGTYPVQTAPEFFQVMHGILPLSYAAQAFRSLISGGSLGIAQAVPVLLAWLVASLAATTFAAQRAGRTHARARALATDGELAIA